MDGFARSKLGIIALIQEAETPKRTTGYFMIK